MVQDGKNGLIRGFSGRSTASCCKEGGIYMAVSGWSDSWSDSNSSRSNSIGSDSPILELPLELLMTIFERVKGLKSFQSLSATCRQFRAILGRSTWRFTRTKGKISSLIFTIWQPPSSHQLRRQLLTNSLKIANFRLAQEYVESSNEEWEARASIAAALKKAGFPQDAKNPHLEFPMDLANYGSETTLALAIGDIEKERQDMIAEEDFLGATEKLLEIAIALVKVGSIEEAMECAQSIPDMIQDTEYEAWAAMEAKVPFVVALIQAGYFEEAKEVTNQILDRIPEESEMWDDETVTHWEDCAFALIHAGYFKEAAGLLRKLESKYSGPQLGPHWKKILVMIQAKAGFLGEAKKTICIFNNPEDRCGLLVDMASMDTILAKDSPLGRAIIDAKPGEKLMIAAENFSLLPCATRHWNAMMKRHLSEEECQRLLEGIPSEQVFSDGKTYRIDGKGRLHVDGRRYELTAAGKVKKRGHHRKKRTR